MAPPSIHELQSARMESTAAFSMMGLVVFDCLLTLPDEVQHMWKRKKTGIFLLFVVLKWTNVISEVINAITFGAGSRTVQDCFSQKLLVYASQFVRDICIVVTFSLRCYAIWNRNLLVGIVLACVCMAYTLANGISDFAPMTVSTAPDVDGCNVFIGNMALSPSSSVAIYLSVALDALVVLLITSRTVGLCLHLKRLNLSQGLAYHILRDGVLYFLFLDLLVSVQGILYSPRVKTSSHVISASHVIFQVRGPLSAVVVQRFILNLRHVANEQADSDEFSGEQSVLGFAHDSVLGNIGAPMMMDDEEHAERDEAVDFCEGRGLSSLVDRGVELQDMARPGWQWG